MLKKYFKIYLNLALIIFVLPCIAQEKLELKNADVMKGSTTPKGNMIIANGNVFFIQGDLKMFCQRVTWYKDHHETIFEQHVKFDDGEKLLTADKIFYNDLTRITRAIGNVVVIDSLRKINADKTIYYENKELIIADDNVVITDNENEVILTGQHSEYWRNKEYASITGDPVLIKKDSSGQEEIRVTGNHMELFAGGEHTVITDSVRITHNKGKSKCNRAEYFKSDNRLLLLEEPLVWQNRDRMSGDEIELYFENRKLNKVIITGQALVTSPADTTVEDSRFNRLVGEKITLLIKNNVLNEVLVEGRATCYYHILEKGEYKGVNKIIGDKITMNINDSKINKIIIESDPESSSGIYYPPGKEPEL